MSPEIENNNNNVMRGKKKGRKRKLIIINTHTHRSITTLLQLKTEKMGVECEKIKSKRMLCCVVCNPPLFNLVIKTRSLTK